MTADPHTPADADALTSEELDEIEAWHTLKYPRGGICYGCGSDWPCDVRRLVAMARRGLEKGPIDAVACHGCEVTMHGEHVGRCSSCQDEAALWCCACWDADDTGCITPAQEATSDE